MLQQSRKKISKSRALEITCWKKCLLDSSMRVMRDKSTEIIVGMVRTNQQIMIRKVEPIVATRNFHIFGVLAALMRLGLCMPTGKSDTEPKMIIYT